MELADSHTLVELVVPVGPVLDERRQTAAFPAFTSTLKSLLKPTEIVRERKAPAVSFTIQFNQKKSITIFQNCQVFTFKIYFIIKIITYNTLNILTFSSPLMNLPPSADPLKYRRIQAIQSSRNYTAI